MPYGDQSGRTKPLTIKHSNEFADEVSPDSLHSGELVWNKASASLYFRGPGGTLASVQAAPPDPSDPETLQAETVAYVAAVEAEDGQALEDPVVLAIDGLVSDFKEYGLWEPAQDIILLAGPRSIAGGLINARAPNIVGFINSNFNNLFQSADIVRAGGWKGNGSTKTIVTSVDRASLLNNLTMAAYVAGPATSGAAKALLGAQVANADKSDLLYMADGTMRGRVGPDFVAIDDPNEINEVGVMSVTAKSQGNGQNKVQVICNGTQVTDYVAESSDEDTIVYHAFSRNNNGVADLHIDARLGVIYIGQAADRLDLLHASIDKYMAAIVASGI